MAKSKPAFHRLLIDIDVELHAKLKAIAKRNERSVSKQAKVILKEAVEHDARQAQRPQRV